MGRSNFELASHSALQQIRLQLVDFEQKQVGGDEVGGSDSRGRGKFRFPSSLKYETFGMERDKRLLIPYLIDFSLFGGHRGEQILLPLPAGLNRVLFREPTLLLKPPDEEGENSPS